MQNCRCDELRSPSLDSLSASRLRLVLRFLCPVLVTIFILCGQEQPPKATFRVETGLLQIEVRVKNRNGNPVPDLKRDEFTLSENGQTQQIATFDYIGPRHHPAPATSRTREVSAPNPLPPGDSPAPIRIYIVTDLAPPTPTCGSTWEYELFHRGVRRFLEQEWRSGTEVSFGGTPFTADRNKLSEMLALMRRYPNGRSSPGKPDWVPPVISSHAVAQQAFECEDSTRPGVIRLTRESLVQQGGLTLERFIGLTRKLGQMEGKKIVVLFSRGLAAGGRENVLPLERLAREALRARVSFYSVIPTALLAPNSQLATQGTSRRVTRGLFAVAENTGGRAIQNTNDFSDVFQKIYDDNSDYYLLGYYPKNEVNQGRFRKIAVSVSRPALRVEVPKGYYEPKPFTDLTTEERKTLLEQQVLGDSSYAEIPLTINLDYFRDEQKRPFLAFSVGVSAASLPVQKSKSGFEVALKIAATARPLVGTVPPLITEQTVRFGLNSNELEKIRADPQAVSEFPFRMPLTAGPYLWKVVVRDEHTGSAGSAQSKIDVPDFLGETSPSSLLLTPRVNDRSKRSGNGAAKTNSANEPPGIDVGPFRFYPPATNSFVRGKPIYMVYELYNVPQQILDSPPAPRVFLLFGEAPGKPLNQPPFRSYQAFPSKKLGVLSYAATCDTGALEPGEYNLVATLPDGKNAIFKKFTLASR